MGADDFTPPGPASYDGLAEFYARYWGPRYHEAAAPVLQRLAYRALPAGAPVLDLCCGTGHLSSRLHTRGYAVVGLDASQDMLRVARKLVPAVPLVCADAAACGLSRAFDAVLCTFDSLNHVLDAVTLGRVFTCVAQALRPGGRFVFDVNTEHAYVTEWQKSSAVLEEHAAMFLRGDYEQPQRIAWTDITMFWEDTASGDAWRQDTTTRGAQSEAADWHRRDVRILQRPWEPEELAPLLARAGFSDTAIYDAETVGMDGEIAVGRIFVTARR